MHIIDLPLIEQWLLDAYIPDEPRYPYDGDLANVGSGAWNIHQTSGTTGLPKPISLRIAGVAAMDYYHRLPETEETPSVFTHMTGKRIFTTFGSYQYAGAL